MNDMPKKILVYRSAVNTLNYGRDAGEWVVCEVENEYGHPIYVPQEALRKELDDARAQNKSMAHKCSKMWESRRFWKDTCRANANRVERAVEMAGNLNAELATANDQHQVMGEMLNDYIDRCRDAEERAEKATRRAEEAEAELNSVLDSRLEGYRALGERAGNAENAADALRNSLREKEERLSQFVEWYDKYITYLSGAGLGTLAHLIRASRSNGEGQ